MLRDRRRRTVAVVAAAILALVVVVGASFGPRGVASFAHADVIHLVNGKKVVGEIVKETPSEVKVKLKSGTITLRRDEIFEIERRKEPLELHADEAAKAKTAEDWCKLAKAARDEWGLEELVWRADFEKAIEIDPENLEARGELGYKKKDGVWLPEADWREAEGFVQFEGRWVEKEKAEKIIEERKARLRERVAKGTEGYRSEIEGVPWPKAWKVETPHYVVKSNAGKSDELAREYADFMELLHSKLSRIFSRLPIKNRDKRSLYILRNQKEFMEMNLLFEQGIGGFYIPGTHPATGQERIIVAYHGQFGATGNTYGVLAHEGTHQFEHMLMDGPPEAFVQRPIWLIEGLAVLIGDGHFIKSRKMEIGIPRDRLAGLQRAIRAGNYRKLKDLIRLPQKDFGGFEYAHAWGLIYYMLFGKEPFNYGGKEIQLGAAFENFLKANLPQAVPPEAFEAEIGGAGGLEELEKKWKEYILALEIKKLGKTTGETYASKELGFQINRPSRKWKFIDEVDRRAGEDFACEDEKSTGRVAVISQPNGLLDDAESLAERIIFSLNGRLENAAFLGKEAVTVKGHEVVKLEYKGTERKSLDDADSDVRTNPQRYRLYVFTTPKRFYLVRMQADEARFEECIPELDKALATFEILLE